MTQPGYRRPFEQSDFRGYFRWPSTLTRQIGGPLYHACHRDELKIILADGKLRLRSKYSLILPKHGLWSARCAWVGLNYFRDGNYYGPFLIALPLSVLNGRQFMVFRRKDGNRWRYFFVQYEAHIPIYRFGNNLWRKVDPYSYFMESDDTVDLKPGGIYDITITEPAEIDEARIEAVDHPLCISGKCNGIDRLMNRKMLRRIAKRWKNGPVSFLL